MTIPRVRTWRARLWVGKKAVQACLVDAPNREFAQWQAWRAWRDVPGFSEVAHISVSPIKKTKR
jgi:hypothetical protein